MTTAVLIRRGGSRIPSISGASASASTDRTQTGTGSRAMSFGNDYEKFFAERWSRFCRENFANATQGAAAFGVRERTFENWLAGINCPSGVKVGLAFVLWPDKAGKHLTGQDQCGSSSGQSSAPSSSSATSSQQGPTGSRRKRQSVSSV